MEKDFVHLDIDKYLELRDFKNKIENGEILVHEIVSEYGDKVTTKFFTKDEIIKELNDKITKLSDDLKDLINNNKVFVERKYYDVDGYTEYSYKYYTKDEIMTNLNRYLDKLESKNIELNDILKMSCREFRKLKRKNRI